MKEWADSIEKPPAKARDWVLEEDGAISGWVRTADARPGRWFTVTWGREAAQHLPRLVAAGLGESVAGRGAVSTVAAYAEPLAAMLEDIGFQQVGKYDILVRLLAERVTEARGAVAVTG
jgi:hypothetical protein